MKKKTETFSSSLSFFASFVYAQIRKRYRLILSLDSFVLISCVAVTLKAQTFHAFIVTSYYESLDRLSPSLFLSIVTSYESLDRITLSF